MFGLIFQLEAGLVAAAFDREAYENATKFDETGFPDDIKRQLKKLKDIGSAALEPSKVERVRYIALTTWVFVYLFSTSSPIKIGTNFQGPGRHYFHTKRISPFILCQGQKSKVA